MRKKDLILVLIFIFLMGLAINLLLTTKKATNISWIASEKLSDIDGRMFEINDVSGKRYTILNFWATWCPPCIDELPSLNNLSKDLMAYNIDVLAVSMERGNPSKLIKFLEKNGGKNLVFFQDKNWSAGKNIPIKGLPVTLIVKNKVNIFLISNEKEIKIIVNDDGPGFPKDIIKKLGEPYIKSRSLQVNSNSGLGLGTFLGKTLLERQNAKLLFKDDKNLGGASVVISWSPKNILL